MTRARDLARLGNINAIVADTNNNVGIGSTTPDAKLDVIGIVSATSFYGSGANLTGIDATSIQDSGGTTRAQANTSGINITGVCTATSFSGSGEGLTGVASTDYIITGTAATFNSSVDFNYPIDINKGVNLTGVTTGLNVTGTGTVTTLSSTNITATKVTVASNQTIDGAGVNVTGVITATSFSGSGANLTNLPGVSASTVYTYADLFG